MNINVASCVNLCDASTHLPTYSIPALYDAKEKEHTTYAKEKEHTMRKQRDGGNEGDDCMVMILAIVIKLASTK